MNRWLMGYYADDFTGATDAMEWLERAGVGTLLSTKPPSPELLARFPDKRAVGIAGTTRAAMSDDIPVVLKPALVALCELQPEHIHYKVCSTFDSSPSMGSIGRAMDVAAEVVPGDFIPLVVGAPQLGRFCVFGHLFAKMGIGSDGKVFRLDRHPAMMNHPTTPTDESDLRQHLSLQTTKTAELFDVCQLAMSEHQQLSELERLLKSNPDIVLFDACYPEHLASIGRLLDHCAGAHRPFLSFGSSAIELALTNAWVANGQTVAPAGWPALSACDGLLVLSGSCSATTMEQVAWAAEHGCPTIRLDVHRRSDHEKDKEVSKVAEAASAGLQACQRAIVYTHDETQSAIRDHAGQFVPPREVAKMLSEVAHKIMNAEARFTRLCIAGGDTSSYLARELGIEAIEFVRPSVPGAPWCRVVHGDDPIVGLEVVFKGGQVGGPDYFEVALDAGASADSLQRVEKN